MRKYILFLAVCFVAFLGFGQEDHRVKVQKKGDLTEATYFYENGQIEQFGTFNAEGKLHGEWTSFNLNGQKVAVGKYVNGLKEGKWFFWSDNALTEVDFSESKITKVSKWTDKTRVALRN
ncbi:MAG: nicotinic acid mononucleotide adenyltransferase [Bacteroidia bacterium]|nr:nicotinic acid mononucleotide adenyltransferase [Bacteroidia bacterium]